MMERTSKSTETSAAIPAPFARLGKSSRKIKNKISPIIGDNKPSKKNPKLNLSLGLGAGGAAAGNKPTPVAQPHFVQITAFS